MANPTTNAWARILGGVALLLLAVALDGEDGWGVIPAILGSVLTGVGVVHLGVGLALRSTVRELTVMKRAVVFLAEQHADGQPSPGGQTGTASAVLDALTASPQAADQVAARAGLGAEATTETLRRLAHAGVAQQREDGWVRR